MSQAVAEIPFDLSDEIKQIVTEDEEPVADLFSAKQRRFLTRALYSSWQPAPSEERPHKRRRFLADVDIGIFFALYRPLLVPDFFLSLDEAHLKQVEERAARVAAEVEKLRAELARRTRRRSAKKGSGK